MKNNKKLVFEDGKVFYGTSFGSDEKVISEVVFNTSMVGYQEIISDNSYCDQAVVMTYPLIGNYGVNHNDEESVLPMLDMLIVKEVAAEPSHYLATNNLDSYLKRFNVRGLSNVDTRAITRHIRDNGSQLVCLCDIDADTEQIIEEIKAYDKPMDEVKRVSTQKPYRFENKGYKIVAIDCGIKLNIIRELVNYGFDVTVLPHNATKHEVLNYNPDGLFLSNGPGNPEVNTSVVKLVQELQDELPIFGICLGHQIIALANGCTTEKMKFGHRGANHPVKNLQTGLIEITSQNHSYAVNQASITETELEVTHINLLDNTVEGLKHKTKPVFSVQYHPESAPGPEDSTYLFAEFKAKISEFKGEKDA